MLGAFTVGFQEVYKNYLLLLLALPSLIDTLCTVASYDVATKVLNTERFPQHTIVDLNSSITNKHIHTK